MVIPKPSQDSEFDDPERVTYDLNPGPSVANGLTVLTATVFMVGEMAGSGILALPKALDGSGYIGAVLIVFCAFVSSLTGKILGECWLIVQERYDEYKGHVRYPYPAIGQIAYGKFGRVLVSFATNFTMLGGTIVFLILASDNVHMLLHNLAGVRVPFCLMQVFVAAALCPFSWLGTPKDFWPIAVGAAGATGVACVIMVVAMVMDQEKMDSSTTVLHSNFDVIDFFSALGTMMYAFGGHPAFPTFQTDMKEAHKFGKAVKFAYVTLAVMYLPVALAGYIIYGKSVQDNVLNTLTPGPLQYTCQILITCHLVCSFIICLNPVAQELEELCRLPSYFSWRRVVSRTVMVGFVLFVAESVPRFGAILSLVGGSAIVLTGYICPPMFYLKLCSMEGPWLTREVPLHMKVALLEIALVFTIIGGVATYSAISELASPNALSMPCYVNSTAGS